MRVRGASEQDDWTIRTRHVINATGPFTDQIRTLDVAQAHPILQASSGAHIVLDAQSSAAESGMLIPKTDDGRVLFILPWMGYTLVGTTDHIAKPAERPPVRQGEIECLLRHAKRYCSYPMGPDDIKSVWAGIRPLMADPSRSGFAWLSRDHAIVESESGLITIAGGKWTTSRKMAEDTMDYAAGVDHAEPGRTKELPLVGADSYDPEFPPLLQDTYSLDPDVVSHLNHSYGDRAELVARLAKEGLDARLARRHPCLEAGVWVARHELAQTPIEVLARRTRIAILDRPSPIEALPRVV